MKLHVAAVFLLGLAPASIARGQVAADPPSAEAQASASLAERLARHPIGRPNKHPREAARERLFLLDVTSGSARPIADEPAPGSIVCGSPCWSADGRRILFTACPPATGPSLPHIWSIELADEPGMSRDLGPGHDPSLSPDGRRIAFLSNDPGTQLGVHLMDADGSGRYTLRSKLGFFGRPSWSPDGRQILVVNYCTPPSADLVDSLTAKSRSVELSGRRFRDAPAWAGPDLLVAAIGADGADAVALIDVGLPKTSPIAIPVANPSFGPAKVRELLWEKGDGPDLNPGPAIYHAGTGRCVFVDRRPGSEHLMTVVAGDPSPPKRLDPDGSFTSITGLAFSPDGRYVLFSGNHGGDAAPR